ncbi:competence type IV pilus minor pilin ComGF [Lactobacillus sp. UCMA15818]|uniref:competence type IV pilus minor pilin ComGF n=1 Tax=Lactobacillaceae TaxID=33958 RepID=UPI0025AEF8F3|nr:competence type IV pilus minor pilin ComGF [Lactobacillus sp. UCMA15818]
MRRNNYGFTLLESLLALLLTIMMLITFSFAVSTSNKISKETNEQAFFKWEQAMDVLSYDSMRLKFVSQSGNVTKLYNESTNKEYLLYLKDGVLKLTGDESGYQPLLDDVSFFNASYDQEEYMLKIRVKFHDREYYKELVLAIKKGD